MSYNVKNTAGNTVAIVPDRHIDKDATSVALVGYNATSYGLDHAENFVRMLEHFASDTPPPQPMVGQLWWDTTASAMRSYNGSRWAPLSASTPTTGADPTEGGVSGVYHCPLNGTSVAVIFAGGKIVAVVANRDLEQAVIPPTVTIDATAYTFRALFPFGLQGGVNLADGNDENNPDDYVFSGRVPLAEQAHFAGGGVDDAEVSGWGYIDIAPGKSVGLMISCGQVIAAVSSGHVFSGELPNSFTFYVKKDRDTGTGTGAFTGQYKGLDANYNAVTCQIKSRFPAQSFKQWVVGPNGVPTFDPAQTIEDVALFPGLTMASAVNANGGINQIINSLISSQKSANDNAIATATTEIRTWVDTQSATALKLTSLEATFTSKTGTTSVASAVDSLIARASDTGAVSTAITNLKTEFTTALGTTSFGEALNKLQTSSNASGSNASAITSITSAFTNKFGGTTIAEAVNRLYTNVDEAGKSVSGWGLSLNSNGYVTGVEALNGGASNNYFKVTASNFIIGDNNIDFIPFRVSDGTVYMQNVVAEKITYGSLVPAFGGSNNLLNPSAGYQILPGGLIIQWGRVRLTIRDEVRFNITFPMQFPNSVMSITAMPYLAFFNDNRDLWMQNVGAPTNSGATFCTQSSTKNSQQIDGFDWMAYGY